MFYLLNMRQNFLFMENFTVFERKNCFIIYQLFILIDLIKFFNIINLPLVIILLLNEDDMV